MELNGACPAQSHWPCHCTTLINFSNAVFPFLFHRSKEAGMQDDDLAPKLSLILYVHLHVVARAVEDEKGV